MARPSPTFRAAQAFDTGRGTMSARHCSIAGVAPTPTASLGLCTGTPTRQREDGAPASGGFEGGGAPPRQPRRSSLRVLA